MESLKKVFDVLDYTLFRLTIFILALIGGWALVTHYLTSVQAQTVLRPTHIEKPALIKQRPSQIQHNDSVSRK